MTELHNYLQNLAVNHLDIAHDPTDANKIRFKRNRIEEIQGGTSLDLNNFCLLYYCYEGKITGQNIDQLYDRKKVTIVIAKNYAFGDFDNLDVIQDDCLAICKDIHTRMIFDYANGEIKLLPVEVDYYKFYLTPDNIAATAFEIDVDFSYNSNYNPLKWL
jgi:hypothetical protein